MKKYTYIYTFFLSFCLTLWACKKKESGTTPSNSVNSTTTTGTSGTTGTGGSNANGAYGQFFIKISQTCLYNSVQTDTSFYASFSSDSSNYQFNILPSIDVGNVEINGSILNLTAPPGYYTDWYMLTKPNIVPNYTCSISGNSSLNIGSYVHTLYPNFPSYSGLVSLPDTFSLSSALNLTLSGVSNVSSGTECLLCISVNSGGSYTRMISKPLILSSSQSNYIISFTVSELSVLTPTDLALFEVIFTNTSKDLFINKKIEFLNILNSVKYTCIVP